MGVGIKTQSRGFTTICTLVVRCLFITLPPHPYLRLLLLRPPLLSLTHVTKLGLFPSVHSTSSRKVLPSKNLPPHTAPKLSVLQFISHLCSVSKLCISPPHIIYPTSYNSPGGGSTIHYRETSEAYYWLSHRPPFGGINTASCQRRGGGNHPRFQAEEEDCIDDRLKEIP